MSIESRFGRKYGWFPSLPDFRDFKYRDQLPVIKKPPMVVDLISTPVQEQGKLGSCTFNAITTAIENVEMTHEHSNLPEYSRLFGYYSYRKTIGAVHEDSGANIRESIKVIQKKGICLETCWPYVEAKFKDEPPAECWEDAEQHKIKEYYSLGTLNDMLSCIATGFGFVFGIAIYESFETDQVSSTGIVPMPGSKERFLGGHAIFATGYNQHIKMFKIQNSWGANWGQDGFFWLPFDYVTNPNMAMDFYTIRTFSE